MSLLSRWFPWIVVSFVFCWLVYVMLPVEEPASAMKLSEFGNLVVQDNGRTKPIDTLARVNLTILSGRQTFYDEKGNQHPAVEWLLDTATSQAHRGARKSASVKAFRIDDAEIRQALGLEDRSPPLYAYEELDPHLSKLLDIMRERLQKGGMDNQANDSLLDLAAQIQAYSSFEAYETPYKVFRIDNDQLLALLGLEPRSGFRYAYWEFVPRMSQLISERDRIKKVPEKERSVYDNKAWEFIGHVELYAALANLQQEFLQIVPPTSQDGEWKTLRDALQDSDESGNPSPAVASLRDILSAYAQQDAAKFNKAVAEYRTLQDKWLPGVGARARFEAYFNYVAPFFQCFMLYILVFLLAAFSWIGWSKPLARAAFLVCMVTLAIHTGAIIARMILQGRPPVTNLYSSAVFVGWACVGLGLVLEGLYTYGIGSAAASVLGLSTAWLAHYLAGSGDTLEMMQAVLDTNFWLATHVTAVTIGYAATLLAGVLGILYILFGLIATPGSGNVLKVVNTMIYGIVCFATLFSFTGTVLGGIWADQSWGRFWGWDPKENGALIIVVWNALLLHARWAGMVKQRGVAVLSVAGIMVTIWSWIGTNQLEIGLHAYGFNSTLALVARYTWLACLGIIAVGALTPIRWWRAMQRA
jgi:ABC-type transport system involved in cytochrome c biogenesis permease subunit